MELKSEKGHPDGLIGPPGEWFVVPWRKEKERMYLLDFYWILRGRAGEHSAELSSIFLATPNPGLASAANVAIYRVSQLKCT